MCELKMVGVRTKPCFGIAVLLFSVSTKYSKIPIFKVAVMRQRGHGTTFDNFVRLLMIIFNRSLPLQEFVDEAITVAVKNNMCFSLRPQQTREFAVCEQIVAVSRPNQSPQDAPPRRLRNIRRRRKRNA